MNQAGIRALVLGSSGEIGKQLMQELINNPSFTQVTVITRRQLDFDHQKIEQKIVDFEKLSEYKDAFGGAQVGFCCLGTTRGKSGAKGFTKVDRDYVHEAAKLLKDIGCSHFHLVSSTGANKNSPFLYPKTKGEIEELVTGLEFSRLSIYRPSLLLCDREESRPFEWVAQVLAKGFDWRSKASISTETVAHAMITNTLIPSEEQGDHKVEVFCNTDILRLGID